MTLPAPPVLKTTIIQLNKDLESNDKNYEILTNDYSTSNSPKDGIFIEDSTSSGNSAAEAAAAAKKKRRRSSANVDSEELAKRRTETKQLHSIIEKRRRIKINREFEALKYLIPACRSTTPQQQKKTSTTSNISNNGNKIDGMYKLTILKSSVEYILYLHHIIKQQHNMLTSQSSGYDFEIDFAKVPLDVNQYRNIDKEFDFRGLLEENSSDFNRSKESFDAVEEEVEEGEDVSSVSEGDEIKTQLPSPDITPDMAPILTMLKKYGNNSSFNASNASPMLFSSFSYPVSANTSPLTIPNKTSVAASTATATAMTNGTKSFSLPDPAINPENSPPVGTYEPKRKLFKSKVPINNTIVLNRPLTIKSTSMDDLRKTFDADQDASKALLALRKSSIDSLLN
ncbi:transcriptional regulator of yeast form adherence 6 [[Candida] anglica]|uniref:Transcriptional regulator of yeast form adherence 6 n=1 Tax=[Candida] anglica TaxID=148631 RepID=A0ABP0EQD5_9ASCO